MLVYSETSFQAKRINKSNPRAIYFDDHVAVGWVRGGEVLEIAAQDPRQGTIFYTVQQSQAEKPRFSRNDGCLSCHLSWDTLAVPGPFVLTTLPRRSDRDYANGSSVDHRTPLGERWGGWYVTGERVPRSMANLELIQPAMSESGPAPVAAKPSLANAFDLTGYLTPHSDIVALMVLEHQVHATNLITRAGWEFRLARTDAPATAAASPRVREAVDDLVDYFLFVDEAPLQDARQGVVGIRGEVFGAGTARQAGAIAARAAAADAVDALSAELHDLLAGIPGAAGGGEVRRRRASGRGSVRARQATEVRAPERRRPDRDRGDPCGDEGR